MATYQQFFGRFDLTAAMKDFSIVPSAGGATSALALTAGYRYIRGYTSESTLQVCENMQERIRTIVANATVTFSDTLGLVVIDFLGTAYDITWTDSALQTLLGFTGTQVGSSTYTAQQQPRYVWRPTLGASTYPLTLENGWLPRSTTRYVRSKDGTPSTVKGTDVYDAMIEYTALPQADVIRPSSGTVYRDLQTFWLDVAHEGLYLRYQPDRTAWATGNVYPCTFGVEDDDGDALGSFGEWSSRHVTSYNGLWDVSFRLWKCASEPT